MKKCISVLTMFILLILSVVPVFATQAPASEIPAEHQQPLLVDDANLLTSSEESKLLAQLNEISSRQKCDVVIITVYSLGYKTATQFADDYYDYNGYGYGEADDGILFLISMEERDWAISTFGIAVNVFTDANQQYIVSRMRNSLSNDSFKSAFNIFADTCDTLLTDYYTQPVPGENGITDSDGIIIESPYVGNDNTVKTPMTFRSVLIALAIGLVVAFIATGAMRSKLKSVRHQAQANNYVRQGSFVLTDKRDIFLTTKRTRVPIPKPSNNSGGSRGGGSSVHTSSSGRSHGGSSGKF